MEEIYYIATEYDKEFEIVLSMVEKAKSEAEYKVNHTVISLYWEIGKYIYGKIQNDGWGKSTVKDLSKYILTKKPGAKGYSTQNI